MKRRASALFPRRRRVAGAFVVGPRFTVFALFSLLLLGVLAGGPHAEAQPANDSFAKRTTLSGAAVETIGTTRGATREPGEPDHLFVPAKRSVWWQWTAPRTGTSTLQFFDASGGDVPPPSLLVAVYEGTQIDRLTRVNSLWAGDGTRTFPAVAGHTYVVAADSPSSAEVDFGLRLGASTPPSLEWSGLFYGARYQIGEDVAGGAIASDDFGVASLVVEAVGPDGRRFPLARGTPARATSAMFQWPAPTSGFFTLVARAVDTHGLVTVGAWPISVLAKNDAFADAQPLSADADSTVGGDLNLATDEGPEPWHNGFTAPHSLWWSWTPTHLGLVTLTPNPNNFDLGPLIAVYTGDSLANLKRIGAQVGGWSFYPRPGETYRIALDGSASFNNDIGQFETWQGSFQFRLHQAPPPALFILTPEAGAASKVGRTLTVQARPGDPNSSPKRATLRLDGIVVGTVGGPDFQWEVPMTQPGRHTLQVEAANEPADPHALPPVGFVVRPAHDDFADAERLAGAAAGTEGTTAEATLEAGETGTHPAAILGQDHTVWYQWTAPASGPASLRYHQDEFRSGVRTFAILRGANRTNLTEITRLTAQNRDGAIGFTAIAGETYRIVAGVAGSGGSFNLLVGLDAALPAPPQITFQKPALGTPWLEGAPLVVVCQITAEAQPVRSVSWELDRSPINASNTPPGVLEIPSMFPGIHRLAVTLIDGSGQAAYAERDLIIRPANDDFERATSLAGSRPVISATTIRASREPGEPPAPATGETNSVWYRWTAPATGYASFALDVYTFGIIGNLAVYTGDTLSALRVVATTGGLPAESPRHLTFPVIAGTRYSLAVTTPGDFNFQLSALDGLQIEPTGPLQSEYRDGNVIRYTLPVAVANRGSAPSGPLRVRVVAISGYSATSGGGDRSTHEQTVAIFPLAHPLDIAAQERLTVVGDCPGPEPAFDQNFGRGWGLWAVLEESWENTWLPVAEKWLGEGVWPQVSGFNGPGGGVIKVDSNLGNSSSSPVQETVQLINDSGTNNVVHPGESAQFRLKARVANNQTAVDFPSIAARWSVSAYSITPAGLLSIPRDAAPGDLTLAAEYHLAASTRTISATLRIQAPSSAPRIISQPAGPFRLRVGEPLLLRVEVSGEPGPSLQWFRDDHALAGEQSNQLQRAAATLSDAGLYRLAATNAVGIATTDTIEVRVSLPEPPSLNWSGGALAIETYAGARGSIESSPVLGPAARWTVAAEFTADREGRARLDLPPSLTTRFYRVRLP